MSKISYEIGQFGWDYIIYQVDNEDNTVLIQTDWDYPGLASTFGWENPCKCGESDGTVDCKKCKLTTSEMITSASQYLDDNEGKVVDDPGYFE